MLGDVVKCPNCQMVIVPKPNGICPSCQTRLLASPERPKELEPSIFEDEINIPPRALPAKVVQRCRGLLDSRVCRECHAEAATRQVQYHALIGAVFFFINEQHYSRCCRTCSGHLLGKACGRTLIYCWLSPFSVMAMPLWIFLNLVQYGFCLFLPGRPPNARSPRLTTESVARIAPHADEMLDQMAPGATVKPIVRQVAERAQVTEGDLLLYVLEAARQS